MYRSVAQLLPCMFLTLLPGQVFPETVKAVFVSKPLPEHAPVVMSEGEVEAKAKHRARARKGRPN